MKPEAIIIWYENRSKIWSYAQETGDFECTLNPSLVNEKTTINTVFSV